MRATVVHRTGPPSVLALEDVPVPVPRAGEVTIDVHYAGVGLVDALFRDGSVPFATPFVPGIEVSGVVREVGPGVSSLRPGQRVAAMLNDFGRAPRAGGYAEVAVAHELMCVAVPHRVDLKRLTAALVNGVTGWVALHDVARVTPADTVLVLGAGGGLGGTTARLAAHLACAEVVGVVSRDRARAPQECTDVLLAGELGDWLTDRTVDVVIDPVGGEARRLAFEHLAPLGRHVVLGDASGEDAQVSTDAMWFGTTTVSGLNLAGLAVARPTLVHDALATVVRLVARGLLAEPEPAVRPLADARLVHEDIASRTAAAKTVLAVGA